MSNHEIKIFRLKWLAIVAQTLQSIRGSEGKKPLKEAVEALGDDYLCQG